MEGVRCGKEVFRQGLAASGGGKRLRMHHREARDSRRFESAMAQSLAHAPLSNQLSLTTHTFKDKVIAILIKF